MYVLRQCYKKQKDFLYFTNFRILIYIFIHIYIHIYQIGKFKNRIIYSYTTNVNLMLICTKLSEMWLFIVNML